MMQEVGWVVLWTMNKNVRYDLSMRKVKALKESSNESQILRKMEKLKVQPLGVFFKAQEYVTMMMLMMMEESKM